MTLLDYDPKHPVRILRARWKPILLRVKEEIGDDHLPIISAGVAFYALLAVIPALAALISIYGLVADPAAIQEQIAALGRVLPENAHETVTRQMTRLSATSGASLGLGALVGIGFSLWSSSMGTKALIEAMNIAYDVAHRPNLIRRTGFALLMTLGSIATTLLALSTIVALPPLLAVVGMADAAQSAVRLLRWPILFALVCLGVAVFYRYAPYRDRSTFRWVLPGAVLATLLWLLVSLGFSHFVSTFGRYSETYGPLGAFVVFQLWFFLSVFVVLLGAELNAEIERQVGYDEPPAGVAPQEGAN